MESMLRHGIFPEYSTFDSSDAEYSVMLIGLNMHSSKYSVHFPRPIKPQGGYVVILEIQEGLCSQKAYHAGLLVIYPF